MAACLASGEGSVASNRAAARLWGIARFRSADALEITTPTRRRSRLPGVIVHDSQVLGRRHVAKRSTIPVTSVARTLCDLTASCTPWQVAHAVDDALMQRLTTLRQLKAVFLDLATKGRRRSTIMRAVLEERLPGTDLGESPQENKVARWLLEAGLPRPVHQHRVRIGTRTIRLDLAWPPQKVDVEYDGWESHRPRSVFESDRERDNALRLAHWTVLRFTSRSTRAYVIDSVRQALKNASM